MQTAATAEVRGKKAQKGQTAATADHMAATADLLRAQEGEVGAHLRRCIDQTAEHGRYFDCQLKVPARFPLSADVCYVTKVGIEQTGEGYSQR